MKHQSPSANRMPLKVAIICVASYNIMIKLKVYIILQSLGLSRYGNVHAATCDTNSSHAQWIDCQMHDLPSRHRPFSTMGRISPRVGEAPSTYSHSCQQHYRLLTYNAALTEIHLSVSAFPHDVRCRARIMVPIHEPDCKPRAVTKIIPTMRLNMRVVRYIVSLSMS